MINNNLINNIAENIRNIRMKLGLSQEQLADILELSPSSIYRIEAGQRSLSLKTLLKFIWKLDIPPDRIIPSPQKYNKESWEYEFSLLVRYYNDQQISFILRHIRHLIQDMNEYFKF